MPTYDYVCEKCGYRFERFGKMSDEPIIKCPKCKGSANRQIGKGTGIIFKRSGFYVTDYRRDHSSTGTCCGRAERCEKPPCSEDGECKI